MPKPPSFVRHPTAAHPLRRRLALAGLNPVATAGIGPDFEPGVHTPDPSEHRSDEPGTAEQISLNTCHRGVWRRIRTTPRVGGCGNVLTASRGSSDRP